MALVVGGLDIARSCGYAAGPDSAPAPDQVGVWRLPAFDDETFPRACGGLYAAVNQLVKVRGITYMAIEAALMIDRKSAHTERCLMKLNGAAIAGAANAGATVGIVAPDTWRKAFLGHGYPPDPKDACIKMWKSLGVIIDQHDAAEAGGVWFWGVGQARKRKVEDMANAGRR